MGVNPLYNFTQTMFSSSLMPREQTSLFHQLHLLEELIPKIDHTYSRLTHFFKRMIPILKKGVFNVDDQVILKDLLHQVHQELDEFHQFIRRGEGEFDLIRGEMMRLKAQPASASEDLAVVEAELWALEQSLVIREKGLNHLNDLVQLLDSMMRVGEMTEFDERLLTDIVTDLKNLAES